MCFFAQFFGGIKLVKAGKLDKLEVQSVGKK